MKNNTKFSGFTPDSINFLANLYQNNNKAWFNQNKQLFKNHLESPAQKFLETINTELANIYGLELTAKLFRIYRDIRFSKDKTPYNTHLRMSFSAKNKINGPALMLSIEHDSKLILGCGIFEFSKEDKKTYRERIADIKIGAELETIIQQIQTYDYKIDIPVYKKIPSGYEASHPMAEFLKAKGVTIWQEPPLPKEIYSDAAVQYCIKKFEQMLPLFHWLNFK